MAKFKARPTVYRGIQMRSRLEAGFASWLDKWGFEWEYEPACFASPDGQYLPDFLIRNLSVLGEPTRVYAETKPQLSQGEVWDALNRMAVILDSEPESGLMYVSPGLVIEGGLPSVFYREESTPWQSLIWTWARGGPPAIGLAAPILNRSAPLADGYWEYKA